MTRPSPTLFGLLAAGALLLVAALPASAQRYTGALTFQASLAEYPANLRVPEYRSYGVMLGVDRPGRWWSPHLWLQRYDLVNLCRDPLPGESRCRGDGWSLSVGPSIQFVRRGSIRGYIVPQLGLDSRNTQEFTGGAGVHLGWDAGFFQPQVFGRFQSLRGWDYLTVGVAARVSLFSRPSRTGP